MEAAGIEPASADAPDGASTSLGSDWISTAGRFRTHLPTAQPSFSLAPPAIGSPSAPARLLMPLPGHGPGPGRHATQSVTKRRVRDCLPHLRLVPVVLRGRPETSACSSTGEPTTSKPWRPRMFVARIVAGIPTRCALSGPSVAFQRPTVGSGRDD